MHEHARRLAEAEVSVPADEIRGEILDDLLNASSAVPAGHVPDFHLELVEGLGRDAPFGPVVRPRRFGRRGAGSIAMRLRSNRRARDARRRRPCARTVRGF